MREGHFIQAAVTTITKTEIFIGKTRIGFDYLVLAMGSSYGNIYKTLHSTTDYRKIKLQQSFKRLQESKEVLVIGGGNKNTEY